MSSPEERELSLIGKVELRIALADTDAKLQSILNTYLAPLLLKLASEHVSVRNKASSSARRLPCSSFLTPASTPFAPPWYFFASAATDARCCL